MKFLRVNTLLRVIFLFVGIASVAYGLSDVNSEKASRKGLDADKLENPFSYYFTVSKKMLGGGILILISLSPILGKSKSDD